LKKYGNFKWNKKFDVSEQNFTEGKAAIHLSSVMQCAKLRVMIRNFNK